MPMALSIRRAAAIPMSIWVIRVARRCFSGSRANRSGWSNRRSTPCGYSRKAASRSAASRVSSMEGTRAKRT
jgi:hypothetical protein